MNIKITKEENDILAKLETLEVPIGSRFYGTNGRDSDHDFLRLYIPEFQFLDASEGFPLNHLFQFDDVERNRQYIYSTGPQFGANLYSGESTINAEVVLWGLPRMPQGEKLTICRTFNIIKGFLGRAKKDLKCLGTSKDKGNRSLHVMRGLYVAEQLLDREIPDIKQLRFFHDNIDQFDKQSSEKRLKSLRSQLTRELDSGTISRYPRLKSDNSLIQKQYDAVNTKEWEY